MAAVFFQFWSILFTLTDDLSNQYDIGNITRMILEFFSLYLKFLVEIDFRGEMTLLLHFNARSFLNLLVLNLC